MIVNVCAVPLQLTPLKVYTGVTVTLAICVVLPVLVAENDAIFPVPDTANPMKVLSLVQLNEVAVPEKLIAETEAPSHND